MCVCVCVGVRECVCVSVHVCVCMWACMSVFVCVWVDFWVFNVNAHIPRHTSTAVTGTCSFERRMCLELTVQIRMLTSEPTQIQFKISLTSPWWILILLNWLTAWCYVLTASPASFLIYSVYSTFTLHYTTVHSPEPLINMIFLCTFLTRSFAFVSQVVAVPH